MTAVSVFTEFGILCITFNETLYTLVQHIMIDFGALIMIAEHP